MAAGVSSPSLPRDDGLAILRAVVGDRTRHDRVVRRRIDDHQMQLGDGVHACVRNLLGSVGAVDIEVDPWMPFIAGVARTVLRSVAVAAAIFYDEIAPEIGDVEFRPGRIIRACRCRPTMTCPTAAVIGSSNVPAPPAFGGSRRWKCRRCPAACCPSTNSRLCRPSSALRRRPAVAPVSVVYSPAMAGKAIRAKTSAASAFAPFVRTGGDGPPG